MNAVAFKNKIEVQTEIWRGELPHVPVAQWPRLNAHQEKWISAVSKGFGHRTYLLQARTGNEVTGVLPLCLVNGPIFGKFLVSLPYVNTGGVWARDEHTATALISSACDLADKLQVKYLELRHEFEVDHSRINFQRTDKVHMRLELPTSSEELLASFKSKVRSQVKKSMQFGHTVEFGGRELVADFYRVFAANMRDLGTPVFSKGLFENILRQFGDDAELCLVFNEGAAAAAGLLVHANRSSEVPSASCIRKFNRTNANMFMYWHMLKRCIDRGSRQFDFGRSSADSGTYRFKAQWGAKPHPAVWQYYVRDGDPPAMTASSDGKQRLVKLWQRLPLWLTKLIGPTIVRGIP